MGRMRVVSVSEADAGHALAQATLLEEIGFEAAELFVDEIVGLVNQADRDVRDDFGRAGIDEMAV